MSNPSPDHEATVEEVENTKYVQKARVFLPLQLFDGITVEAYREASALLHKVRDAALKTLDVTEANADVTAVDYALDDIGHAIVTVTQVST